MIAASSCGRDHIGQWLVGQVDPGDVAQLGDAGEPRVALLDGVLVFLGREARADHRGRQVQTRVVGQRDRLAQHATRHGHGATPERLELLLGEPVEVLLRRELLPVQWLLDGVEVGIQRGLARGGVDVDHRRDQLGDAVARDVAGEPRPAVHGEHDGTPGRLHRLADRVDVVGQRDRGTVGVDGLETGQRQRGDVVAVGAQRGGDLVPRPRAQPEPGNQDDRCVRHALDPRGGHRQPATVPQARCARSRCTVPATPLSSTGPISANAIPSSVRGVGDRLGDQHLAGPRVVGDARGEVHGLAEVVALLKEDRPRVQADVRRRQPGGRQPVHHLEGGSHAGARVAEVEHHAVAEPLDGLAAVLHGAALHQPRDRRRPGRRPHRRRAPASAACSR